MQSTLSYLGSLTHLQFPPFDALNRPRPFMNYEAHPPAPRPLLSRMLPYILMLLVGYLAAVWYGQWNSSPLHDPNAKPRLITPRGQLAEDEKSTIDLFRANAPAVVFITTTQRAQNSFSFNESELNQGGGSGFVWDTQGHIVTNDHVIANADRAQVTLSDQSVWDATLVGRAPGKDLAVLKISASENILKPILLGESNNLSVGQKVFAIGNPFGLDHTLTTGVISALGREIRTNEQTGTVNASRTIDGVIQTDAAINPGNSGGPLLDSAGLLIGVNTAIYSPSGAYAGIGFAIPVDTVNRIVPDLIRNGQLTRPSIGVVPVHDWFTRQQKLKGVLFRDVLPDSPADQAGLEPTRAVKYRRGYRTWQMVDYGDLIVAANGEPIKNLDEWFTFLESHKVGQPVELTIIRGLGTENQEELEIPLTLMESS